MELIPEILAERVATLRKLPVFSSMSEGELEHIAEITKERPFRGGDVLIQEGAVGSDVFLILSGRCEVRRRVGKREKTLATLEPGQFFGEMAVLSPDPRTATVAALESGRALVLSAWEFQMTLSENATIASRIARVLAERLRDAEEQLAEARQRLR